MNANNLHPKKNHHPNTLAITSLALAIAPIIFGLLFFFLLLFVAGGAIFGDVGQALWPLFLIFLLALLLVGILVDILAVIFGILAIRKQKTFFSWLGIMIVALKVLLILI